MTVTQYLEFEKPLAEIEGKAEELRALARQNEDMDVTDEAAGLDAKAAKLLEELYEAALTHDNQCRLQWKPGTVAIWDNRTSWHNAINDYAGHYREMHRITLSGEALAA